MCFFSGFTIGYGRRNQPVDGMSDRSEQLTHLVYEASLDNSLWPELILELTEQLHMVQDQRLPDEDGNSITDMADHFQRAFTISERMVGLQEREAQLSAVLDTFAFGLALIDEQGQSFLVNRSMTANPELAALFAPEATPLLFSEESEEAKPLRHWVQQCNRIEQPRAVQLSRRDGAHLLILPRREAVRMGFPAQAAAVVLSSDASNDDGLRFFAQEHGLSPRETQLVGCIVETGDLKKAAAAMGLSYESARTYIKRIYDKTGSRSQVDLVQAVAKGPLSLLRHRTRSPEEAHRVRRLMTLSDGRQLEYFSLGSETGQPVVHFDALAGITIDAVGYPAQVLHHLEAQNLRLITPCRPGGFRSTMRPMNSLCDFAPDIIQLLDHLNIRRFSIFSVSFGVGTALGVAHELQGRIDRVVLSSPSYPSYRPENWRELDLLYQLSGVLGRKWPGMLRQIIPFLVRSITQNVDRYFDRYCAKTQSEDDIWILSHTHLRSRMAEMLAERTAEGMEGMVEENLLNAQGWDFDVGKINVPVEIFHGAMDRVSPPAAGQKLAEDLPDARFHLLADKGHYHHVTGWPWLAARSVCPKVAIGSAIYDLP